MVGSSYVYTITEGAGKTMSAIVEIVGLLFLLFAFYIWGAKLYGKLKVSYKKLRTERILRTYILVSSSVIFLLVVSMAYAGYSLYQMNIVLSRINENAAAAADSAQQASENASQAAQSASDASDTATNICNAISGC